MHPTSYHPHLVNDAFLLKVDADGGYEFILESPVGILIKQGGFADPRIAEAQEFDQIVVVRGVR